MKVNKGLHNEYITINTNIFPNNIEEFCNCEIVIFNY